jgi:hypothetical protein
MPILNSFLEHEFLENIYRERSRQRGEESKKRNGAETEWEREREKSRN